MKRLVLLAIAAATIAPRVTIGQSVDDARRGIRAMFDSLNAAGARRDRAALERVYAPEFRFVHGTTGITSRQEQIDALIAPRDAAPRIPVPPLDSLRIYGDIAIAGQERNGFFSNNVWVRRDGHWQIMLVQITMLPSRASTVAADARRFPDYVGRFELDSLTVTVSVESDSLMVQRASGPRHAVKPTGTDTFTDRFNGTLTFERDASGVVIRLKYRTAAGAERTWLKAKPN